jgi:hypothetical protein
MLDKRNARAHCHTLAPGLDIYVLGYRPVFWLSQLERLRKHLNDNAIAWSGMHDIFIMLCPLITSLKLDNETELPPWAEAFVIFYEGYGTDIVENWLNFEQIIDSDHLSELWAAYNGTRNTLPKATPVIQQNAPVPVLEDGLTENPPIASGGKRSKKR